MSPGKGFSLHTRCRTLWLVRRPHREAGGVGSTALPQAVPAESGACPQLGQPLSTPLSTAWGDRVPDSVDPVTAALLAWWTDGAPGLRTAFARGRQATSGARVPVSPCPTPRSRRGRGHDGPSPRIPHRGGSQRPAKPPQPPPPNRVEALSLGPGWRVRRALPGPIPQKSALSVKSGSSTLTGVPNARGAPRAVGSPTTGRQAWPGPGGLPLTPRRDDRE